MDLQGLGSMLREHRGNRSIRSVAKHLNISTRTYRLAKLGRQRPQIRTCHVLAGFLNKSSDEILTLAGYEVLRAEDDNTIHDIRINA
jgi:DNA-binding XRE family transcriptional regulator